MKKYLTLIVFIFSGSLLAQEYFYQINNAQPIKVNNTNQSIPEPDPEINLLDCYDSSSVGKIGDDGECKGKLIVNNAMLKNLVNSNSDYSYNTIFTGQVTDIGALFFGKSVLHDITGWNVSNVQSMWSTFLFSDFNQDISGWNVSNVREMGSIFSHNFVFNQDISSWNTSNVINMSDSFSNAHSFNQDISSWNVSKVENMDGAFWQTLSFNQDLSRWCVPLIMVKPSNFDYASPLSANPAFQPTFGLPCN